MNVTWERKAGTAIAKIEGRIDGANFWRFQSLMESGLDPEVRTVVADFEQVAFVSSAGLRVVLMLGKQLRKRGAKLGICSLKPSIREIFVVSNVDRILPVHGSETEAIDALAGQSEPDREEKEVLRNEIDFDIVGDNLKDIAGFTVEKYEYINDCTLSQETRERVLVGINKALWECVEQSKRERLTILQNMFIAASSALDEAVNSDPD